MGCIINLMSTHNLTSQKCVPCEGNVKPYTPEQVAIYRSQVPLWEVKNYKKIVREFKLKDFAKALKFVNLSTITKSGLFSSLCNCACFSASINSVIATSMT